MKTYGNLYPRITSFQNLYNAAMRAAAGKRRRPDVNRFLARLEPNLSEMRKELLDRTYRSGTYDTFEIYEPKRRLISKAPFRNRVVHHALVHVMGPLFEQRFIYDCWANRLGMGTHRAMDRFQQYARRYRFLLKCDVRKYFASMDHDILKAKVRRTIRCRRTLWLIDSIIDGSNPQDPVHFYFPGDDLFAPHERRRGMPVGNLTSQLFANVYLDALDHYVKEELGCPGYLRYVDDFVLFSDERAYLWECRQSIIDFLAQERLKIHENRCRVSRSTDGTPFLGFRIWPDRRRLRKENARRMQRRLKGFREAYRLGQMDSDEIGNRIRCWLAHANHGDTRSLVKGLFRAAPFTRAEGAEA